MREFSAFLWIRCVKWKMWHHLPSLANSSPGALALYYIDQRKRLQQCIDHWSGARLSRSWEEESLRIRDGEKERKLILHRLSLLLISSSLRASNTNRPLMGDRRLAKGSEVNTCVGGYTAFYPISESLVQSLSPELAALRAPYATVHSPRTDKCLFDIHNEKERTFSEKKKRKGQQIFRGRLYCILRPSSSRRSQVDGNIYGSVTLTLSSEVPVPLGFGDRSSQRLLWERGCDSRHRQSRTVLALAESDGIGESDFVSQVWTDAERLIGLKRVLSTKKQASRVTEATFLASHLSGQLCWHGIHPVKVHGAERVLGVQQSARLTGGWKKKGEKRKSKRKQTRWELN